MVMKAVLIIMFHGIALVDALKCFTTEIDQVWINNKVNCNITDTMCYSILHERNKSQSRRGCTKDEKSYKEEVDEAKNDWKDILPLKCRDDFCNDQNLDDLESYYLQCYMCGFEAEDAKSCYKDFNKDYNKGTCSKESWCALIIGDKGIARRGCTTVGMNFVSDEECEKAKEETNLFGNIKCEKCRGNYCNKKPGTSLECYTCDSGLTPSCRSDLNSQWMTTICSEENSFCYSILSESYAVRGCANNNSYNNKCNVANEKFGSEVTCSNCAKNLCNSEMWQPPDISADMESECSDDVSGSGRGAFPRRSTTSQAISGEHNIHPPIWGFILLTQAIVRLL